MKEKIKNNPITACTVIFLICAAARVIEYFVIRTDETVLAENFIHKLFGIILLFAVLKLMQLKLSDIGFKGESAAKNLGKGLLLGAICFFVSYTAEYLIAYFRNGSPHFEFYASGFSISGDSVKQTGIGFIALCIGFNIINVIMEEGIFRGLFREILEYKYSFAAAMFFSALLFGIWHWVMPMRSFLCEGSPLSELLVMGIGYIILSGIMSIKWTLLYKMTGSLWAGIGDHLFNNTIATNLLHIVSGGDADSMQIVRVMLAQLISFIIVLIAYKKYKKSAAAE